MSRLVAFVLGTALGLAMLVGWQIATPDEKWLHVRTISVADAVAGEPIVMAVDRTIHREFRARWIVTVRRLTPDGLETVCIGRGENDYRPGASLPRRMTLNYWADAQCALAPGQYRLTTLWTIDAWPMDREVRADSNLFRIH